MSTITTTYYSCPHCNETLFRTKRFASDPFPYGPQIIRCSNCNIDVRTGLRPPTFKDLRNLCLEYAAMVGILFMIIVGYSYFKGGPLNISRAIFGTAIVIAILWIYIILNFIEAKRYYRNKK